MLRLRAVAVLLLLAVPAAVAAAAEAAEAPAATGDAPAQSAPVAWDAASDIAAAIDEARTSAEAAGEEITPLSLRAAVLMALENNLDIRIAGYDPRIAWTEIDRSLAVFDPVFAGSMTYSWLETPTFSPLTPGDLLAPPGANILRNLETDSWSADLSIAARATSGGTLGLGWRNTRTKTNATLQSTVSPAYGTNVSLQAVQPLLRTAGVEYNRSGVVIAQNNAKVSALEFQNQVMDLLLAVEQAYWTLAFTIGDLRAREISLQAADDLLRNNLIKFREGVLAQIEVTRAQARVAERKEGIVLGAAAVREAEDRLRTLLDSSDYRLLTTARLFPTDSPGIRAVELDLDGAVNRALALRPDIRRQVITLESLGIVIMRARNQLLPEVNVQATLAVNGLGEDWSDDYEVMWDASHTDASIGIAFSIPIGNRAARAGYSAAQYQKMQGLARLAALQRNVTYSVKRAVRNVRTALQSVDTNRVRVQAAAEQLEAERQRFAEGQSIALDVLDAQDTLQQAQSAYVASVVGFNIAMANYYRETGLNLAQAGVEIGTPATIDLEDGKAIFP
jgi:HAE1 family hydrophobic/amphiphilic exporter-1